MLVARIIIFLAPLNIVADIHVLKIPLLAVAVLIISLNEASKRNGVPPDGFFRDMILG